MRLVLSALVSAGSLACATQSPRVERHFDGGVWGGAFAQAFDEPEQAWPAYALAAATPLAFLADDGMNTDDAGNPVRAEDATAGDWLSLGLGVGAVGAGAIEWAGGDRGRSFEVALESIAATSLATSALKSAVGRRRPGDSASTASFPSGHTSFAFAGATFFARRIQDDWGGGRWGYLLYAPAAYVGFSRVDAHRHFPSDVAAGALLGVVLTNWIYDAHYGEGEGEAIFSRPSRVAWSFGAIPTESGVALGVGASF